MKTVPRQTTRWVLIALALLLAAGVQPALAQNCAANQSWVTSPSQPNFNVDPNSLCQFYQYAWQSFLALTAQAPGAGGALNFETLTSVTDVMGGANALKATSPLLGAPTLFIDKRQNKARRFQVRGSEPMNDINQAGSKGVLVDQNGNVTYYEQFLDPVAQNFIDSCQLDIGACQTAPAAQTLRFPAGSIEIKVSWRPLPYNAPNLNTYYTIQNVEVFNPQTGQNQTWPNLGLVGFHLVYTTAGHPEMVWASFEHIDNAPDGPCVNGQKTTPPPGFTGWAFSNVNNTDCSTVNQWNKSNPPQPPYPITQAYRNWKFGTGPGSSTGNAQTIQSLNNNVMAILPASSVWKNYFLVGAIWTNGQLPAVAPGGSGTPNEFGSVEFANATMETFTQTPNPQGSASIENCFSCHNAETTSTNPPNPPAFKVSHTSFFTNQSGTCPYSTTLPAACSATQPGGQNAAATVEPVSSHSTAAAPAGSEKK